MLNIFPDSISCLPHHRSLRGISSPFHAVETRAQIGLECSSIPKQVQVPLCLVFLSSEPELRLYHYSLEEESRNTQSLPWARVKVVARVYLGQLLENQTDRFLAMWEQGLVWVVTRAGSRVIPGKDWAELKSLSRVWLCDPMDCSPPGSSVHGIFRAWVLEWVAISFSRGSSQPRDRTRVSHILGRCFTVWATREVLPRQLKENIQHLGELQVCFSVGVKLDLAVLLALSLAQRVSLGQAIYSVWWLGGLSCCCAQLTSGSSVLRWGMSPTSKL